MKKLTTYNLQLKMGNLTYTLFKQFKKDDIGLVYQGDFNGKILAMVTILIKKQVEGKDGFSKLKNKLSFLMAESFQNIIRYADSHRANEMQIADELFINRINNDVFYISTSNIVENKKIGFVKEKIENVNNLNESDLKELYFKVLTNKQMSDQGGAGLGFIEMVRKSKEKLDFDFEKINDELSLFHFQIKIKSKKIKDKEIENPLDIERTKKIYQLINNEKILLIHKGTFNEDTVMSILSVAEDNTKGEKKTHRKKAFHTMVETLQNISKHAFINAKGEKEGIFIFAKSGKYYTVRGGNYIEKENVEKLDVYLNKLSKMTKDELNTKYRHSLRGDDEIEANVVGGLGLIDLFRESKEPILYDFEKASNGKFFYSIKITI